MSRTQIFIVVSGIALLAVVLELVRRRRLREEYSWLWLLTAIGYLLMALFPDLAAWVGTIIGSDRLVSVFTFLGFFFLFVIAIQFSVQISRLTEQNKDLAQQIAILDCEQRKQAEDGEGSLSLDSAGDALGAGIDDALSPLGPGEPSKTNQPWQKDAARC